MNRLQKADSFRICRLSYCRALAAPAVFCRADLPDGPLSQVSHLCHKCTGNARTLCHQLTFKITESIIQLDKLEFDEGAYNMYIKLLDNAKDIRKAFIDRFVVSWEEFQIQHKDWIIEMSKTNYPITADWYEKSFMWEKMDSCFPTVSFNEALAFLKEHSGSVFFITEKGNSAYCQLVDFTAEADAHTLAARIEQEWYDDYRLDAQNMYNPDAYFPSEVYVFDATMNWCVAFTHETTDWESELDDTMKAAESSVCIICKG